jgi:hypothetical protein
MHLYIAGRPRHFEGLAEALFRFGMAKREELEFESEERPCPVVDDFDIEFTKGFKALLPVGALAETGNKAIDVRGCPVFEESQEQVFLALEMGVDGSLAAVGPGGNLIELGCLIAVAHEHFFGGSQEPGLRFLGPKLLFTSSLHGDCTHLIISVF